MSKKFNFLIVVVGLAVVALTVYKGGQAVIGYIEKKAVTEVANKQLQDQKAVLEESADLKYKLNVELGTDMESINSSMNDIIAEVDLLLEQRQANPVELPATVITATAPVVRETSDGKVVTVTRPIVIKGDTSELTLAWKAFCQMRPSYKACLEGTRP